VEDPSLSRTVFSFLNNEKTQMNPPFHSGFQREESAGISEKSNNTEKLGIRAVKTAPAKNLFRS
jgi:hypothetical protein